MGDVPVIVVEAATCQPSPVPIQSVIIGVDGSRLLPVIDAEHFDVLLTTQFAPPAFRIPISKDRITTRARDLANTIRSFPRPAAFIASLLRMNRLLSFEQALAAESFAYSTLLGSDDFLRWRGV